MNFSNITWLDDRGHIKPPIFLYLILIFIARGWCVFIASLTQASDRAGLVALIYPQKTDFMLALASGVGALILYGVIIAERKRAPSWVRPLFARLKYALAALLLLDGWILIERTIHSHYFYHWSLGLDAVLLFWSAIYLWKSKRLTYYLADWHQNEQVPAK